MCHAMPFSARALKKKNIFFDVDIVVKNKSKCGFSWYVLLSITSTRHYSFPKYFFELFLQKVSKESDAYKQLICIMQRVHFQIRVGVSEAYHLKASKFSLYVGNNAGVFIRPIRATEYFLPKYGISGLS